MKKRYQYSLLFAVPGFFISLIIAFAIFGATAGFLWLFVFGDNAWPAVTDKILPLVLVVTFLVLWVASIGIGFIIGKKLEAEPVLNKKHLLASALLTAAPILFIVLHQLSVGNLGPKPAIVLCNEFCLEKGFPICEMPPEDSGDKSCICLDASGQEVLKVPMESIIPAKE